MSNGTLNLTLHIWRQKGPNDAGGFVKYELHDVSEHMSFLEMLDWLNEDLISNGKDPVAFDHDCREGICGACGVMINGVAHGPQQATATCQLHMRKFSNGDEIYVEPWRARAFPLVKDLVVDRGAFDRVVQAGGYVSIRTGSAPEANTVPIPKRQSDAAFDAAACIGCGACVAACPNASGSLFMSAKAGHLASLPQGQAERSERARKMVAQHDHEGFGACTNHRECEAVCPQEISIDWIAQLNADRLTAWRKAR